MAYGNRIAPPRVSMRTAARAGRCALVLFPMACAPAAPPPQALREPSSPALENSRLDALAPSSGEDDLVEHASDPGELDWGTPHPVLLAAADPERRWLALCQAREDSDGDGAITVTVGMQGELGGDALRGYFVLGGGPGEPIDSFAGADPTGRHVALVQNGRLWLLDVVTGDRHDLSSQGADPRDDARAFLPHRAVAFSADSRHMLYFRGPPARQEVVLRTLGTNTETAIPPGEGLVWRASFEGSGALVRLHVVTEDTNRNGKLDWPAPELAGQRMRCPASITRFPVREHPGDRPLVRLVPVAGGTPLDGPHHVVSVHGAHVERHPDSALVWRLPDGTLRPLAPGRCESRLLHADYTRSFVIVTCRDPKTGRHRLSVRGIGLEQPLDLELIAPAADFWLEGSPRLVPLHAGRNAALFDAETRTVALLTPGDRIIATHAGRALFVRRDELWVWAPEQGEQPLQAKMDPFGRVLRTDPMVAALPSLVDLATSSLVGHVGEDALAISRDGAALVPLGGSLEVTHPPSGPLRWVLPRDEPR
jgi:hypothetical protein